MDYKNETFEGVPVELDGNTYENCTFDNVVFKYSGGDLEMKDCKFVRFSFVFGGALANGLYALLQLFGIEAMSATATEMSCASVWPSVRSASEMESRIFQNASA